MRTLLPIAALTTLLAVCCSPSTKLVQNWRDPGFTIEKGHYKKMLAVAMVKDETTRRTAEDELARLMPGRAVPSYQYVGQLPETINTQDLLARTRNDGFDGVVIMRLARVEKEINYVQGGSSYATWGYYNYAYPMYADPGYVRTDNYYYIETLLFDVPQDKLVWAGTTSTWEPTDLGAIVREVATAVTEKMKAEGFIVEPAGP